MSGVSVSGLGVRLKSGVSLIAFTDVVQCFLSFLYVSGFLSTGERVVVVWVFDCSLVVTFALAAERSLCRG